MTTANTVFSGPADNVRPLTRSAKVAAGQTIYPGQLVTYVAGEWSEAPTDGQGGDFYIAGMNVIEQKLATEALTAGDTAVAFIPQVGSTYNLVLAASQTITLGEGLTNNGSGELKSAATDGTEASLFNAEEAITTTGATGRVRARYNPGTIATDTTA
jgi:hypothetical protein